MRLIPSGQHATSKETSLDTGPIKANQSYPTSIFPPPLLFITPETSNMFLYPGEPPFPHDALEALLAGMPKHPGEYHLGSKDLVATHPATNPTFKVGQEVLFRRLLDEKEGGFTPWKRGVVEGAGEGGELLGLQNSVYGICDMSGR